MNLTDKDLDLKEKELTGLLEELQTEQREEEEVVLEKSPERIDRIVNRAQFEGVMKDSASFLFESFGVTLTGLVRAFFGVAGKSEDCGKN
ncbi:MAG: hypothetical protein AAF514_23745 [Verrucomicrobiota bacterium]